LKRAVLLFFLAGCGVDATGLTATTAADDGGAELAAPAAHPDADTEAPAAATDTAGEIAAPTPDAHPDSSPEATPADPRLCAATLDPASTCDRCYSGAQALSVPCRAALACLTSDPAAYTTIPVVGAGPDPIGYCSSASSPAVAPCLRAAAAKICPGLF